MRKFNLFTCCFLSIVATIIGYTYFVFGIDRIGKMSFSTVPNLLTAGDVVLDGVIYSFIPSILFVFLATIIVKTQTKRSSFRGLSGFVFLYIICWFSSAFMVAQSYAVDYGATWTGIEIFFAFIIHKSITFLFFAVGLSISVLFYKAYLKNTMLNKQHQLIRF